jgi:hypothetical protein
MAKKATNSAYSAHMRLKKTTPGAYQYEEVDDAGEKTVDLCGSLYLRKSKLGTPPPDEITITVEVS